MRCGHVSGGGTGRDGAAGAGAATASPLGPAAPPRTPTGSSGGRLGPPGREALRVGVGAALLRRCLSLCWRRLARVTILHGCLGCRTFELPPSADVGDVKARIDAEAGFPAARQRLWHCGREVREGRVWGFLPAARPVPAAPRLRRGGI